MFYSFHIKITITAITNTLASLSKADKTKNLSNKKQKSTGSKQNNFPAMSSVQELAQYLIVSLKQAAVVEVVTPEQHRFKFFDSKVVKELKDLLKSVHVAVPSSLKKAQLVELAVLTPALLVPIIDAESQSKNSQISFNTTAPDAGPDDTLSKQLPEGDEQLIPTQAKQGRLSSLESVMQVPGLYGVPNAVQAVSTASETQQPPKDNAPENPPAAEATQAKQGRLSSLESVIQVPGLNGVPNAVQAASTASETQQPPKGNAPENPPTSEETQAAWNAIVADEQTINTQAVQQAEQKRKEAVQQAEQKRKEAHWKAENAKIKGLQFEVRAGDVCDLRIENPMFGGIIGRPMIRENCRILSIGDDLHRRDYLRVWYEYRVLLKGREQDEDEDFFVYKEKGLY